MTNISINVSWKWYNNESFIFAHQAKQLFYLHHDKFGSSWKVIEKVHHHHLWDILEVPSKHIDECEEDVRFFNDAYQKERSNDINITFGDTDIETPLEDVEMIQIDSLHTEFEINPNDEIKYEYDTEDTEESDLNDSVDTKDDENIDDTEESDCFWLVVTLSIFY